MKKTPKYLLYSLLTLVFVTGCMPRIPAPQFQEDNKTTVHRTMWEDTSTVERNYSLKPEPYSLDSKQTDPELLGPQSTLKKNLADSTGTETSDAVSTPQPTEEFLPRDEQPSSPASQHPAMTRSRCIELIGQADYDKYPRQFGSEQAALRKCIILERVQKH